MRLSWPMPRRTSLMSAPRPLAEVRHLVDEADLRRQQGVGHVLGHLGALGRHGQKRLVGPQVRLIQVRQHVDHLRPPGADHHPVGLHEIVDRHPFLEELGIAGHVDVAAGQLLQPRGHLGVGAHRHGALADHDAARGRCAAQSDRRPPRGPKDRPSRRRPAGCPRPETPAGPSSPPRPDRW